MPLIIGLLLRMIGATIVPLAWKLLSGLGFAAISYVGLKLVIDQLKDYAFSSLGALPIEWINVLGLLKIDVCLNIIFSAYLARMVLSGMNSSGNKTSFKWMGK